MADNRYIIISACRNEEAYIGGLIDDVAAQTVKPVRWIIVDDGSTDNTHGHATARAKDLSFIEIVRMPGGRPRSFTSQVYAAQHGASLAAMHDYDFIGFLDADIRVQPDYYEKLMDQFRSDRRLGLVGGTVIDQYEDRTEDIRRGSEETHVAGGVQFFRRECFNAIGGYVAIPGGGQDTIADVMVQMHGWSLRAFPQLPAMHLRPDGFARDNVLQRGMKWGRKFYLIGYHPLFYFGQCVRRLGRRPFLLGSVCQMIGFLVACLKREKRPVPPELVRFLRRAQLQRVRNAMMSSFVRARPSADRAVRSSNISQAGR